MTENKLPADPLAMILGIIAILSCFTGCCCAVLFIIPLILSIIGLLIANKSLKEYSLNHEAYSPASRSNVSIAKVLNIVVIICSSLAMLFGILFVAIYGVAAYQSKLNDFDLNKTDDDYYNEQQVDSLYNNEIIEVEEASERLNVEKDTLVIDSIQIKKTNTSETEQISDSIH